MTQQDKMRADFEKCASDNGKWPQAIERDCNGNYLLMTVANGWMWWQEAMARAIPPGFQIVPIEPTPAMVAAAEEAHMPFGDMHLAILLANAAAQEKQP